MDKPRLENYGKKFRILQPGSKRQVYNLHEMKEGWEFSEGDIVASLAYKQWFSDSCEITAAGKKWRVSSIRWFNPNYGIFDTGSNVKVGEIRQRFFRDNEVEIYGQGVYRIRRFNFFGTEFGLVDSLNRTLVGFKPYGRGLRDFLKTQADVGLAPGLEDRTDLYLVIMSSWYMKLRENQQSATAAAGA